VEPVVADPINQIVRLRLVHVVFEYDYHKLLRFKCYLYIL